MREYLEQMKSAIVTFYELAKGQRAKIEHERVTYAEDSFKRLYDERMAEMQGWKNTADAEIARARDAAIATYADRTLHGSDLTDDVRLLQLELTPEQWAELVDRYRTNNTMLTALRQYADRRNASNHTGSIPRQYNTMIIPTFEAEAERWHKWAAEASHMLDVIMMQDDKTVLSGMLDIAVKQWGDRVNL